MPKSHHAPHSATHMQRTTNTGILFAMLSALSFGGLTTLAILYYREGGNALTILLFRFAFTSLALFIIASGRVRPPTSLWHFVGILIVGLAWSLGVTFYLGAVHYIDVGIAALILYTFPLIVLALSLVARELRSTRLLWALFLIAFVGLALMLLPTAGRLSTAGLLFAFGSAVFFAITFFLGARVSPGVPVLTMAFWVTLVGLVLTAPLVYWSDALAWPRNNIGWLWLAASIVLYMSGVLFQFGALARARAAHVSMAMNLEPLVSVALGILVLGERLTWLQWAGALAVLSAIFLAHRVMQKSAVVPSAGMGAS